MIFTVKNENDWYSFAKILIPVEGEEPLESWCKIPKSRVIVWHSEGGFDTFFFPLDSDMDPERFRSCAEYVADNKAHMLAKNLELARKCITVYFGEDESCTLDEYIKSGKDPKLIKSAPDIGDYFKAK